MCGIRNWPVGTNSFAGKELFVNNFDLKIDIKMKLSILMKEFQIFQKKIDFKTDCGDGRYEHHQPAW